LTGEIGRQNHAILLESYEKILAEQGGTGPVDLVAMLHLGGPAITEGNDRPALRAVRELTTRFEQLLGLDESASQVWHSSADLAPKAARLFGDARAGWAHAHHHSVDVQVAAPSVDAINNGDFTAVLGEFHLAWNPLESGVFLPAYPDQDYLAGLIRTGYPRPRVMLSPLKGFPRVTARTVGGQGGSRDWWLAVGPHNNGTPQRRLTLTGMVVEREDGRLIAVNRDGRVRFDLVDIGGIWGSWEIMESFKLVAGGRRHTPRVTVDSMVVCRETWTVPMDELDFARTDSEPDGYLGARDWAARTGLPRFVFAKLSSEMKPFYVDLTSPVLVSSLASAVRGGRAKDGHDRTVTFSEMLPAPHEVWVPDGDGNLYTSELRLTVIDPVLPH
jgi:hypothetical protein